MPFGKKNTSFFSEVNEGSWSSGLWWLCWPRRTKGEEVEEKVVVGEVENKVVVVVVHPIFQKN